MAIGNPPAKYTSFIGRKRSMGSEICMQRK
jgi:hypothetical protein